MAELKHAENLRYLSIIGGHINPSMLDNLPTYCQQLKTLILKQQCTSVPSLKFLTGFKKLTKCELVIDGAPISGAVLQPLGDVVGLRYLTLKVKIKKGLKKFLETLQKLKQLYALHCNWLVDYRAEQPIALDSSLLQWHQFVQLTRLYFWKFSGASLAFLAPLAGTLRELYCKQCPALSEVALEHLPLLEVLLFMQCEQVQDIPDTATLPALRKLALSAVQVNPLWLAEQVQKNFLQLQELYYDGWEAEELVAVRKLRPGLLIQTCIPYVVAREKASPRFEEWE